MYRYRILYHKAAPIKYTSNLDLYRVWERSLRRAGIPLAYSQGYHPQPKINLACPLPLGMTSLVELVDIWLLDYIEINSLKTRLEKAVPPGLLIQSITEISLTEPALQTTILSARYKICFSVDIDSTNLQSKVDTLLAATEVLRVRRNKAYDLRSLIVEITPIQTENEQHCLEMLLTASEGKSGRPEEVLWALEIDPNNTKIERIRLNRIET